MMKVEGFFGRATCPVGPLITYVKLNCDFLMHPILIAIYS
jgi:hypothetical protein